MSEKKLEIGVIGLGKFGLRMATALAEMGHTVIGLDMSDTRVQLAEQSLDSVYKADATNVAVLRSLHVQELDWVVISVGHSVEQSLIITLNVQELEGPKIWVKASNEEHQKILERLKVDKVIIPEMEAAVIASQQLAHPGLLDMLPKYDGIVIQELTVNEWDGKTLVDLNLMHKHQVIVMGVCRQGERAFIFVPPARTALCRGDTLVVAGHGDSIQNLQP
jgi:trk system potassium uptake protein TrkA